MQKIRFNKFNPGDQVFIIESGSFVKKAKVLKSSGGFVTIQITESHGAIRVRESRLFLTEEEAIKNKRG